MLRMGMLFVVAAGLSAVASAAEDGDASAAYEPMAVFEKLDGRVLYGEGVGPNGEPIVDIAKWEMTLGGRAFQSTHKLACRDYGGRTIFFYDEGAKKYIFHYFTTAGFHTVGELDVTDDGFTAVEEVIGHPRFVEVRSDIIFDGDIVRVVSSHVDKDGKPSDSDELVYRDVDEETVLFFDEADALFGKRTNVQNAFDRYGKCDE
ncbi:MAG: hypothetical protein ACX939_08205 [Hyphococcus sp.]